MRALLYTTGSPFPRAVRILLDELGLDYEKREEITTPSVAERAAATPTLQVPTLWDGDVHLWQSDLIADYLLRRYTARPPAKEPGAPPLASFAWRVDREWQDKLVLATIQTVGAAVTTISQMTWSGVTVRDSAYLRRSADRLPPALRWLEDRLQEDGQGFLPGSLSVQDVFLACHLRFAENRPIGVDPRVADHPRIAALLDRLDRRASFRANPIRWWEPGVTGYDAAGKPVYAASMPL